MGGAAARAVAARGGALRLSSSTPGGAPASRGGLAGTAATVSPLHSREQAAEAKWAREEDARLTARLSAQLAAKKGGRVTAAAGDAAAGEATSDARTRKDATSLTAERLALEAIVGSRVSQSTKEKLIAWRRRIF